jgi:hypothetical protein
MEWSGAWFGLAFGVALLAPDLIRPPMYCSADLGEEAEGARDEL